MGMMILLKNVLKTLYLFIMVSHFNKRVVILLGKKIIGIITEYKTEEGLVISVTSDNGKTLKNFFNWKVFREWMIDNSYILKLNYVCTPFE